MSTSACPFRSNAERTLPRGFRSFGGLFVFGRLAPGAIAAQASSEVGAVAASFERAHPEDYRKARIKGLSGQTASLQETMVVGARPMLFALTGATMLVLIITCANVANLAVARSVRRGREFALRNALGASRARLARQLITESLIVSLLGGALGLGLASVSLDLLVSFVGRFTARTGEIELNGAVLIFTLAMSVVTGVIFGAAPALAARRDVARSMRDGGGAGEGAGKQRLRAGLVVAQVAVSFVLLVGAALLLQSFQRLSSVSLGFDTDHVMTASLASSTFVVSNNPPKEVLDALDQQNAAILNRLRSSPGVRAAAMTSAVPLARVSPAPLGIEIEGRANTARSFLATANVASDGYFATLEIPLVAGREFRQSDNADAPRVAIINASMKTFWDGADPVGSRIRLAGSANEEDWVTVVGVAADFHLYGGDAEVQAQVYTPFMQNNGFGGGRIIARTDGDPGTLVRTIKDAVHAIAPTTAVKDLKTTAELKDGRLAAPRLTATLLTVFAAVALVITLAGITGVIATSVSQRTREFGLRMALGASRSSLLKVVLGQALLLVVAGLAGGVAGALVFSRALQDFLFATAPTDARVYVAVGLVFLAAGTAACLAPARRATAIDPLTALRAE